MGRGLHCTGPEWKTVQQDRAIAYKEGYKRCRKVRCETRCNFKYSNYVKHLNRYAARAMDIDISAPGLLGSLMYDYSTQVKSLVANTIPLEINATSNNVFAENAKAAVKRMEIILNRTKDQPFDESTLARTTISKLASVRQELTKVKSQSRVYVSNETRDEARLQIAMIDTMMNQISKFGTQVKSLQEIYGGEIRAIKKLRDTCHKFEKKYYYRIDQFMGRQQITPAILIKHLSAKLAPVWFVYYRKSYNARKAIEKLIIE